jgi:hypothetical protein
LFSLSFSFPFCSCYCWCVLSSLFCLSLIYLSMFPSLLFLILSHDVISPLLYLPFLFSSPHSFFLVLNLIMYILWKSVNSWLLKLTYFFPVWNYWWSSWCLQLFCATSKQLDCFQIVGFIFQTALSPLSDSERDVKPNRCANCKVEIQVEQKGNGI